MRKHGLMKIIFIVFLCFIIILPSKVSNASPRKLETNSSPTTTDFNITHASSIFEIQPEGEYRCSFSLRVVGNEQTSQGNLNGSFGLIGKNITNFDVRLGTVPVNSSVSSDGNISVCSFTIDQELQSGEDYELSGHFYGKYYVNDSGIYRYQLGIDWGTVVGYQETLIRLNDRFHTLILPIEPEYFQINQPYPQKTEIKWIQGFVTGFTANFNILIKLSPNVYLKADLDFWNATVGQTTDVILNNYGSITIHGYVLTPNWISSNVTEFTISPYHNLNIRLSISSVATDGMNGTIQIISDAFSDIITIDVHVVFLGSYTNDLLIIFSSISLFISLGAIGLIYQQRNNINTIIEKLKENYFIRKKSNSLVLSDTSLATANRALTDTAKTVWESVKFRWQSILPENELKVIEILYWQGSMNQQAIASEMGVSKMTMSRIISRLEAKRLLFRERLGFSNIIKLNTNHIGFEDLD